jgi:hypothetical protein
LRTRGKEPLPNRSGNANPRGTHVSGLVDEDITTLLDTRVEFSEGVVLDGPCDEWDVLLSGRHLSPLLVHRLDVICPRKVVHPEQDGLTTQVEHTLPGGVMLDCEEEEFAFFFVPIWI